MAQIAPLLLIYDIMYLFPSGQKEVVIHPLLGKYGKYKSSGQFVHFNSSHRYSKFRHKIKHWRHTPTIPPKDMLKCFTISVWHCKNTEFDPTNTKDTLIDVQGHVKIACVICHGCCCKDMGRMKADLSNLCVSMDTGHGRNARRPSVSGAPPSRDF